MIQLNLLLASFDCHLSNALKDYCIKHEASLIFSFQIPFYIPQWQIQCIERQGTAAMLAAQTNIIHNALAIHFLFID